MAKTDIEGFDAIDKILKELPKNVRRSAVTKAGRKAARPIMTRARQIISTESTKTQGNLDGFKHLQALAKVTKVETYKSTTFVRISQRSPSELPMASKRPFWNTKAVAFLFAFGRQNEGKGVRKKSTGFTKGFGDWIKEAGKEKGSYALQLFYNGMGEATEKAIKSTLKRYGKRY